MITDREVESRLKDTLTVVAASTVIEDVQVVRSDQQSQVTAQKLRLSPILVGIASFVAVIVAVGVFAALLRAPGETAQPELPITVVAERYPVFGAMPSGGRIEVEVTDSPANPRYVNAVVGRSTENGFADAVNVLVWENDEFVRPPQGVSVRVGEYDGVVVLPDARDPAAVGATVFWYRGERLLQAHDPAGRVDLALAVAQAVDVDPSVELTASVLRFDDLPGVFEVLADPHLSRAERLPHLAVEYPDGSDLRRVTVTVSRSFSAIGAIVLVGDGSEVDVRATIGYTGSTANGRMYLAWEEAPDLVIKMSAESEVLDVAPLVSIADRLSFVDEETWRSIYPDVGGPALPGTTAVP